MKKRAGLDGLGPLFFKTAALIITGPLTSIFSVSLLTAEIPADWKAAIVHHIFKAGNQVAVNCYRLISVLPCVSKVCNLSINN